MYLEKKHNNKKNKERLKTSKRHAITDKQWDAIKEPLLGKITDVGGTIGSPNKHSIWVCGIEWGGGTDAKGLKDYINQPWEGSPEFGYRQIGK